MSETIENLEIFDYGMNGEGIGKHNGKIVMVDCCLVGEKVNCELTKQEKTYSTAKLKSILTKSSNRTDPVCPYFNICGGCDIQHMSYSEQLKFKQSLVQKTIKKIANVNCLVSECVNSSSQFFYRNKSSFEILNNKIGFLMKKSKNIVEISSCAISNKTINAVLNEFKMFFKSKLNNFKYLVVRAIETENKPQILVGVVVSKFVDIKDFALYLTKKFDSIGICEILNTRNDSVVLSGRVVFEFGMKEIELENFGLHYSVDLLGFHQTNIDIQNKIYNHVLNNINTNEFVVNGFSGQGLLSAVISKKAKSVIGIEINHSSQISAENLKQRNNITNLTNIEGDFFAEYKKLKHKVDTIVLDPTKKGCGEQVMKTISGINKIIYISCNPIALAKDLRVILNDYNINSVVPFDMFPNTKNVETVVVLTKK